MGQNPTTQSVAIRSADSHQYALVVNSDGSINVTATGGGGGAVTIANGADVAEGTTTDTAWTTGAGTVISLLKAIVGAVVTATGTLAAGPPAAAIRVVQAGASAGAETNVAASASDGTILAANAARIGFSVFNDSASATLYLLLATGTSSATNYTVQIGPGAFFANSTYAGIVKGLWSAAVGNARVTENS